MRKLEKILLVLILLATLAKTIPIFGSGIIITIAASALSFYYLFFGFAIFTKINFKDIFKRNSYYGLKPWDIIVSALSGYAIQTQVLGILFLLQYWSGDTYMGFSALITAFPFIILALLLLLTKNRFVYIEILKRVVPLFLFVLILYLIPLTTRLKIFKVSNPEIETQILKDNGRKI